jgi:hypothetical protein
MVLPRSKLKIGHVLPDCADVQLDTENNNFFALQVKEQEASDDPLWTLPPSGLIPRLTKRAAVFERVGAFTLLEEHLDIFDTVDMRTITLV